LEITPENGWLKDDPASFWDGFCLFSDEHHLLLVLGRVHPGRLTNDSPENQPLATEIPNLETIICSAFGRSTLGL